MTKASFGLLILGLFALSACTGGGPRANAILNSPNAIKVDAPESEPYVLVDLGQSFAERVSSTIPALVSTLPRATREPLVIGVSDLLNISIVSNNEDGFIDFTQSAVTPFSTVTLPQQEVGQDGQVSVPTLGRLPAAGQTVEGFEKSINEKLSEVLVNPTAIVRMSDRQSAKASIIGAIAAPGNYSVDLSNQRVLDLVGVAGGPTRQAEDLIVSLSRGGRTHEARLSEIYENASLNVYVRKNDVISVEPNLTRVKVIGGTGTNAQLEFETVDVTLMDVLSEAGGLLNTRAKRSGIFVYRRAPASQLTAIGADLKAFAARQVIPTVFRLDMREPTSLFVGQSFRMMDSDIVYVADNINSELSTFLGTSSLLVPQPVEYIRDSEFGTVSN